MGQIDARLCIWGRFLRLLTGAPHGVGRFGWKGVDCNIQCNGGANNSCSGRGTFDSSNRRGDRESCRAYLAKKTEDGLYDNDGKCVGLKTGPLNPNVVCVCVCVCVCVFVRVRVSSRPLSSCANHV
jgi:hypothetical protein